MITAAPCSKSKTSWRLVAMTEYWRGRVSLAVGDYFASLSRDDEAELEFIQANSAFDAALVRTPDDVAASNNKGRALASLGDLQARQSQHAAAERSYQAALTACDAALARK